VDGAVCWCNSLIFNVKNLIAILTILILTTACKRAEVDLRGHWHVWEYIDPAKNPEFYRQSGFDDSIPQQVDSCLSFNRLHEILDILNDSTAVWNKGIMGYNGTMGWLDKEQQLIEIGGECLHLQFKYDFKNDTLFLTEKDGKKYVATKSGCCDKQKEFFTEVSSVEIDLPVFEDTIGFVGLSTLNRTICPNIEIGKVNEAYRESTLTIRFLLDERFSRYDDVKPWLENWAQTIPPSLRKVPTPIVFANKSTDYKLFFDLLKTLEANGVNSVYLTFREQDCSEAFNVWLKKIELQNFDYQLFIKSNYRDYYQETGEIRVDIEDFN
jgi:hypothetical protein